jgi:hypothetical protein
VGRANPQVLTLYFNAMFHRVEEHESHIRTGEMDDATGKEKLVVRIAPSAASTW